MKGKDILKIVEIVTTTAIGIGSIIATIKAGKMTDDQIEMISDKTAEKVLAKQNEVQQKNMEELLKDKSFADLLDLMPDKTGEVEPCIGTI